MYEGAQFRRQRHRLVHRVLTRMRAELLSSCAFLFAGGTRIALEFGEYRESVDIDFLCSDGDGYGRLRNKLRSEGYAALFHNSDDVLSFPREARTDQYGIRFPVVLEGVSIKVELIREARISLEHGVRPAWSPVDCLSLDDCVAEKLLANSDRWADRSVLSRDLIDLGMLRAKMGPFPEEVWQRVEAAYKRSVYKDINKAIEHFFDDDVYRGRCMEGLVIEDPQELLDALERLRREVPVDRP